MDPSEKQAAKYKSKNMMGYIQDKVDVGMAKLRSDEGVALDVAVVKATLQDEVVPKEKHVRTLLVACSGSAPRQQVSMWRSRAGAATDGGQGLQAEEQQPSKARAAWCMASCAQLHRQLQHTHAGPINQPA